MPTNFFFIFFSHTYKIHELCSVHFIHFFFSFLFSFLSIISDGTKCRFAHGTHELQKDARTQDDRRWKTELCKNYHGNTTCPYGKRCHFIHDESPEQLAEVKCLPCDEYGQILHSDQFQQLERIASQQQSEWRPPQPHANYYPPQHPQQRPVVQQQVHPTSQYQSRSRNQQPRPQQQPMQFNGHHYVQPPMRVRERQHRHPNPHHQPQHLQHSQHPQHPQQPSYISPTSTVQRSPVPRTTTTTTSSPIPTMRSESWKMFHEDASVNTNNHTSDFLQEVAEFHAISNPVTIRADAAEFVPTFGPSASAPAVKTRTPLYGNANVAPVVLAPVPLLPE